VAFAVLTKFRTFVSDTSTTQKWSDTQLSHFLELALDDVNAWAGTEYTFTQLIALSVPLHLQQITFLAAKIIAVQADIQDDRYIKVVDQDTEYDASKHGATLKSTLYALEKKLEFLVRQWIGIDIGTYIGQLGESLGGDDTMDQVTSV